MTSYNYWPRSHAKYSVSIAFRFAKKYYESAMRSEWFLERQKYVKTLSRNIDILNRRNDIPASCILEILEYYPE